MPVPHRGRGSRRVCQSGIRRAAYCSIAGWPDAAGSCAGPRRRWQPTSRQLHDRPRRETMYSAEPLPHFVDDYLAFLHEAFPTAAAFDGVHTHDDLLEDYSRPAIDSLLRDLGSFGRRLDAMRPGDAHRGRAARAAGARSAHPRAAVRVRAGAHLGAQPAALRRDAGAEPGRRRRCSPTRRPRSGPGACCRSCGRRRGCCSRRATTSRSRPASS